MKLLTSLLFCVLLVAGTHAKCLPKGDAKNVPSLMSFCGASRGSGYGIDEGNVWVVTSLRPLDYYDNIAKERYEKHTGPGGVLNGKSDDCKRYYKSVQCLSVLGGCTMHPNNQLEKDIKMCQSNCDNFAKWCGDTSLKPVDVDLTCTQRPWSATSNQICPLASFTVTTPTPTPTPTQVAPSTPSSTPTASATATPAAGQGATATPTPTAGSSTTTSPSP
eukprot:TRINITY_DN7552_c0_g1_i1.p1 TRINITY_DN7552_c0_g1~~TRINITY_DN7552_c0_g1_i1.p1  ORF type:complete len:219 (+),score=25.62 TRINITY_DN7552_c0_g1_i1:539-1195(+)